MPAFAGRRLTYVNPVRLMLTAVIAFALLVHSSGFAAMNIRKLRLSLLPPGIPQTYGIEDTIKRLDLFGILSARISRMKSADLEKEAAVEKFHHELKNYSTVLSFSNVVLLAAFLFLLFHGAGHIFCNTLSTACTWRASCFFLALFR